MLKLKRKLNFIEAKFPRLMVIRAAILGNSIMYKMTVSPDGVSPQTQDAVIMDSRFKNFSLRLDSTWHD